MLELSIEMLDISYAKMCQNFYMEEIRGYGLEYKKIFDIYNIHGIIKRSEHTANMFEGMRSK